MKTNFKLAVIDCGTNTFNLIIASKNLITGFDILYNQRIPVMLGKGGITNSFLHPDAFERGINAMITYHSIIEEHKVDSIYALGTAALRDAKNGIDFLNHVKKETGIAIAFIDGLREAELIYKAAIFCTKLKDDFLVLDIGGGSNEFIIQQSGKMIWKKSYRLGVSRMQAMFHDVIETEYGVKKMSEFLISEMRDLFEACEKKSIHTLIGTAGSFDSFANVIHLRETGNLLDSSRINIQYDFHKFISICDEIISNPISYAHTLPGIPDYRKEFIKYAAVLCKTLITRLKINSCYYSAYSLKEGLIIEKFGLTN